MKSPNSPHRTVFTDGRELPNNPNPALLGYSIGRWEGDTLVITIDRLQRSRLAG